MTKIISRSEAEAAGLKHYFTGKPCKRGHVAERFVSTKTCMHCSRESTIAWQAANPEKHAKRTDDWNASNPAKRRMLRRKYNSEWAKANPKKNRMKVRKYRAKKYSAELFARIDRGLERTKATGAFLDEQTAIELFRAQHNAFEFIESEPQSKGA
jgi:hypothetical protein